MSNISLYLLENSERDEGEVFDLILGRMDGTRVRITDEYHASFASPRQGVELCFVIESNSTYRIGDLTIKINGVTQAGGNRIVLGENCYTIPVSQQRPRNSIEILSNGVVTTIRNISVDLAEKSWLGLASLTRSTWDEHAVRKVLKIFAYGGHAFDYQIREWSYMQPVFAIREMLNFSEHNLKLSPLVNGERYRETATSHGTLGEFYDYIMSPTSNIPIPAQERTNLGYKGYRFDETFNRMVAMRGLNPFRQRIGFWETNYHLAVNTDAGVERRQAVWYFDKIMEAHEANLPYHEVLGVAAKSAAVAMQYGHRRNQWVYDRELDEFVCECNDDFAREIHQLFFGIFGVNDPNHENGTIPETAKMLTDMRVPYIEDFGFSNEVTFGTSRHHTGSLTILGETISGANASEKIDNLMSVSISHEESLKNLPVMIISVLADDNLNEQRRNQLRAAWSRLGPNKYFLTFIHAYATSEMFHSPDQAKYFTSFDRAYYLANKFNIYNIEALLSNDSYNGRAGRAIGRVMESDNAQRVFQPLHNVFGGQTSTEASDSALAFEKNFNRSATAEAYQFNIELPLECDDCDQGSPWRKDWSKVIPSVGGRYPAEHVAQWLWKHAVGNLDNYSALERAHLLAILGAKRLPNDQQTEQPWEIRHDYPYFNLNMLLCIREDRVDKGQSNNTLSALMAYDSWHDYCRHSGSGDEYSSSERAALEFVFNGHDISNSTQDPYPYLRGLLHQLSRAEVELTTSDELQRRRANERIQAALAFIFATPFVFAEGE